MLRITGWVVDFVDETYQLAKDIGFIDGIPTSRRSAFLAWDRRNRADLDAGNTAMSQDYTLAHYVHTMTCTQMSTSDPGAADSMVNSYHATLAFLRKVERWFILEDYLGVISEGFPFPETAMVILAIFFPWSRSHFAPRLLRPSLRYAFAAIMSLLVLYSVQSRIFTFFPLLKRLMPPLSSSLSAPPLLAPVQSLTKAMVLLILTARLGQFVCKREIGILNARYAHRVAFMDAFQARLGGRRLGRTVKGHFAWLPRPARVGDAVVAFEGCARPFVLRRGVDAGADRSAPLGWRLVGDAFVLGLLDRVREEAERQAAEEIDLV